MSLTKFFQKWMHSKKDYFAKSFDSGATTYFTVRKNPRFTPAAFEFGSNLTPASLASSLHYFWSSRKETELLILVKPMEKLAKELYSIEEQNAEVSPFMYVMY